jgi:hypothetical protein
VAARLAHWRWAWVATMVVPLVLWHHERMAFAAVNSALEP